MKALLFFLAALPLFSDLIDLDEHPSPFVLETKRIEIEGFPHAFNPSVIRYRGHLLMSFRNIPPQASKLNFNSDLYLVWLDDNFNQMSQPQPIQLRQNWPSTPSRGEDARLLMIGKQLYIVYSDNIDEKVTAGGFRMFHSELAFDGETFSLTSPECILDWEDRNPKRREKNWVPFDYQDDLYLAYSLQPHHILRPIFGTESAETISKTDTNIQWDWGQLRGGSQALRIGDEYLAFFHSQKKIASIHSEGKEMLHYVMGAYTFSATPPFEITRISPEPIWAQNFYHGANYPRYWGSVRVVFPCSYLIDDPYLFVTYGRQDHELWVAKIAKQALLDSLR